MLKLYLKLSDNDVVTKLLLLLLKLNNLTRHTCVSYQVLHVIVQLDSHHRVDGGVPFVVVRLASEAVIRLHARNHTIGEVCSFDAQYYFAHAHV